MNLHDSIDSRDRKIAELKTGCNCLCEFNDPTPQWVIGTGAALPCETQAWVAFRVPKSARCPTGIAVRLEHRVPGGWGWTDDADDAMPVFPDDGDPFMLLAEREGYWLSRPCIIAYLIQDSPEPPEDLIS